MTFNPTTLALSEGGPNAPYRWKMSTPLTWTGSFGGKAGELRVPASIDKPFETDLASVPRWLTWLLPRYGKYTKAAVLHDYLCQNFRAARVVAAFPDAQSADADTALLLDLKDRSDADEVFRLAMGELGVPWARRWVMWSAVNWATIATSIWPGRRSKTALRWIGRLIILGAVCAAIVLVTAGAVDSLLGDSRSWRWLRVTGLVIGASTTAAACVAVAGYIAQGRWDRWFVNLVALGLTVASLPLLAAGAVIALLVGTYLLIEDLFSGFSSFRAWYRRRRRPAGQETPRDKRLEEVKAS
jgi:Protein of unknown function (DUF1353)